MQSADVLASMLPVSQLGVNVSRKHKPKQTGWQQGLRSPQRPIRDVALSKYDLQLQFQLIKITNESKESQEKRGEALDILVVLLFFIPAHFLLFLVKWCEF